MWDRPFTHLTSIISIKSISRAHRQDADGKAPETGPEYCIACLLRNNSCLNIPIRMTISLLCYLLCISFLVHACVHGMSLSLSQRSALAIIAPEPPALFFRDVLSSACSLLSMLTSKPRVPRASLSPVPQHWITVTLL